MLGDGTLGTFALGLVIVQIGSTVSNLGLESTMRKYIPIYRTNEEPGKITGLVIGAIAFSVVGGILTAILINAILSRHNLFTNVATGDMITILLLSVPFLSVIKTLDAATLGYDRTQFSVYIRDFGQEGLSLLLIGLTIVLGGTEESIALGYVAAMLCTAVIALFIVYNIGALDSLGNIAIETRELFSYSLVMSLSSVTQLIVVWIDILVLSLFVTRGLVGQYQAAYQTSALLTFALVASNSIFPSIASRLYENDDMQLLGQIYRALVKWISLLTFVSVTYVIILSDEILTIFGTSFQNASQTLAILAVAQGIVAFVGPAGYLLAMTGNERLALGNKIFIMVLNITLNFALVPRLGIIGAAVATGISLAALNLLRLVEVQYIFGIYPDISDMKGTVIGVLISGTVIYQISLLGFHPFVTVILSGLASFTVLMPIIYLLVIDDQDAILLETI